jgi:Spy/CpxP family protein refolding chaperone
MFNTLKKRFIALFGLFLLIALASPALAQPRDDDDRDGPPPGLNLTDAQRASFDKLFSDYQDRIYPILSQLQDQRLLYRLLSRQNNLNLDEAKKNIAEMRRLRDQLRTEFKKFQADLKAANLPEILGVHAKGFCGGGFKGGPGFGPGHRRGFGPGPGFGRGPFHGRGPRGHGGPPFGDWDRDSDGYSDNDPDDYDDEPRD